MLPRHQPSITLPSSVLQDPTKEPLKVILKPYNGIKEIPSELAAGAGPDLMVFIELNKCFKKAGFVAEGMLGNIIWGFEQCGFDPKHVAAGLTGLRKKGYLRYTDLGGDPISEYDFDPKKLVWIRYDKKMVDLFVRIIL